MTPDCNILNPLQRDGLSQDKRLVRALHPSHVAVDERDLADLLLYAKDYARLVQFYSQENNPSGDWRKFIESDITTLVALIVKFDPTGYKTSFEEAAGFLERFSTIIAISGEVYTWYAGSIKDLKLNSTLERVINSILEPTLTTTLAYAKRIDTIDISFQLTDLNTSFIPLDINDIQEDTSLFPSGDISNATENLIAIRKIKRSFQTAYESVLSIVFQASGFLEETLIDYHKHQPHIALFLAFLKLFETAQTHLNTITKRHLDFYYQEVLQIGLRPEQADEVHIVFELAKTFKTHLLDADILLKAGKDDNKANVFFGLDDKIVINKTKLYEDGLKTIFLDKVYDTGAGNPDLVTKDTPYEIRNIYAASKADTLDGIEEELGADDKWLTFGDETMPYGEVGFAIGSPIFLLQEGSRNIKVAFTFLIATGSPISFFSGNQGNNKIAHELMHNLKVAYSGEKEWVETAISGVGLTKTGSELTITFSIDLGTEDPAFLAYQKEVLAPGLSTAYPTLKFMLNNRGLSWDSVMLADPALTISDIFEAASDYEEGKSYSISDIVIFKNEYYYAKNNPGTSKPAAGSPFWLKIDYSYPYRYFQVLQLKTTGLTVTVTGMKDIVLENDVGTINPAKPFLPFGPLPKVGSKFYIGSSEIFHKPLTSLTIDLDWADLPGESFLNHYNEYREDTNNNGIPDGSTNVSSNDDFDSAVEILYNGQWMRSSDTGSPLINPDASAFLNMKLFDSGTPDVFTGLPLVNRENQIDFNVNYKKSENTFSFVSLEPNLERGFIRLNLLKDFLHKQYPKWVTKSAISTAANKQNLVPNEPYTPTIGSFSLNYVAATLLTHTVDLFEDTIEQFFHITPFGWQAFYPNKTDLPEEEVVFSEKLIPEFEMTDLEDAENPEITDAEGTLYIGLQDLVPEQNVSILFQMAEGSADPDLPKEEISWSYLSNNRWVDFDQTQILSDTTNDLLTSGIVTLTMPKEMSDQHTILPADIYWIRVCAARKVKAISQAVAVMPQAVKASFRKETNNDLSRLSTPLSAETIAKLKERQAKVKTVLQPFSSFNGKLIEQNETPEGVTGEAVFNKDYNEYYIRVSERLRHKNRAVTIDDYERIVLQQFSDVYKVKCINHTRIEGEKEGVTIPASEHAPGFVKLIVVPNLRNRNAVNPLQPKVSSNRLDEIKTYLSPLKSDFVTLEVKNPLFEEIAVDFKVRLHSGFDKGFYTKKLKEDIVKFLSPWLYDEGADLPIGGKVHRSVILNFVEETEYVDYVTDFKLNHYVPGKPDLMDVEEAVATTSSSVIVSKAAEDHTINDVLEDC